MPAMTVAKAERNAKALRLSAWSGLPYRQWLGPRALYALSFLFGLAVWEFVASFLPRVVFASPSRVAVKLFEGFANGTIPSAFANSLQHFALGFAIAFAMALPLGLLIGRSRTASMMFSPVLDALFSIPSVAFVPFIMIWFGLYFEARVALVVAMSVLDMLVTIATGARNIDPAAINVARSFGIRGWRRVRSVYMPASLPFIFTALRIGVVRAVNAMITAELFFAAVDLGKIMQTASSNFDAATMLGIVALVSLFGLLLQELVKASEAKLIPWSIRGTA
jgi:NitT/TauT family transport system permease protein